MLPINTPAEVAAGAMARTLVRQAERAVDHGARTLGTALGDEPRRAAANAGTLVMSSGFAGSVRGLGPIARSAARDGLRVERFEIPGGGLGSLDDAARGIDELIRTRVPSGPLHLAGHSKGGVVVQEWWRTASPAQRARVRSMTLVSSTPNGQRTPLLLRPMQEAQRMFGGPFSTILHELSSTSPGMRRIAALDIPAHVRAMSIISVGDELLSTREAAWRGAENVVIRGRDAPRHMETLGDARAYEALRANVLGQG